MLLRRVHIRRFRSLLDLQVELETFTTLVGKNGFGKSAVLRAIELFYAASPSVTPGDFYANDDSEPIEIELTYDSLSPVAMGQFQRYVRDGKVIILRRFSLVEGRLVSRYHGSVHQLSAFRAVREAPSATELRTRYEQVRSKPGFSDLPSVRSQEEARNAMDAWESSHPEQLELAADDGQFFGFTQVARGYLGRYTRVISIPAIRDATLDASEGRGSATSELMDLVITRRLRADARVAELERDVREQYEALVQPLRDGPLAELERRLSEALQDLVPDAAVRIAWEAERNLELPIPRAEMQLVEDRYPSPVDRAGHGLQRAFLMALLQQLASIREEFERQEEERPREDASPDVLLLIEEPELFQHPSRQRHFAFLLRRLAGGYTETSGRTEVICATHSPLFVQVDGIESIRLIRKTEAGVEQPRQSAIWQTSVDKVAEWLWSRYGEGPPFTGEGLRARLRSIMTPWMNEGFFADAVVLVEGEEDRAAVVGAAAALDLSLEASGIAVVPCGGKRNLDRPFAVFKALGIPCYMVWDNDADAAGEEQHNRYLLRLCQAEEEDWPDGVFTAYACFAPNLTDWMRSEIGDEIHDRLLRELCQEYGIASPSHALKNPMVVEHLVRRAVAEGSPPRRLLEMTQAVRGLAA